METEERLRRDTAAKLSEERQQPPHAEADTRAVLAALVAEEGRRWAWVARVARLPEMDHHLPSPRLPLLCCLLLLLILPFYIRYEGFSLFSNFRSPEILQAFGLLKKMMTAAVNFLRGDWYKKTKFIIVHNVQWTPILLVPAIKGTSRTLG